MLHNFNTESSVCDSVTPQSEQPNMLMWFVIRAGHWVQSHGSFNHRASSTRETKLKQHIATSLSLICGAQGPAQPIDLFQLQLQMQFTFSVLPRSSDSISKASDCGWESSDSTAFKHTETQLFSQVQAAEISC